MNVVSLDKFLNKVITIGKRVQQSLKQAEEAVFTLDNFNLGTVMLQGQQYNRAWLHLAPTSLCCLQCI